MKTYDWSDLLDRNHTITKYVNVHTLPSVSSEIVGALFPGDVINLYSFINAEGFTFLMVYIDQWDIDNNNPSFIALDGTPANEKNIEVATIRDAINPALEHGTLTTQEKEELKNSDIFSQITKTATTILFGLAVVYIVKNASSNTK